MKPVVRKIAWASAIVLAVAVVYGIFSSGPSKRPAGDKNEVLFYNANVITVDASNPKAEAVIVSGDRIVFAGSYNDALGRLSAGARRIDLKGKTLIPGFNDDHTHSLAAGSFYLQPILWGKTCDEILEVVKKEAAGKKPGELITGNSWDYTTCPKPHRSMLDRVAPNNPVILTQYSGHAIWVNSLQLKKMGIDRNTPDPAGGQIVRDEKGEPTGILRDTAMGTSEYADFAKQILSPTRHRAIIDKALQLYREAGISSVQDNTWEPFTIRLLNNYNRQGKLSCRFTCWALGDSFLEPLPRWFGNYDALWVRKGLTKYFADGAFSTRTGWLFEPYADEPGNTGAPRYKDADMEKLVMEAAKERRQITFHAIGDRAVNQVLNAYQKAQEKYPWTRELRFRIEHVQIMKPQDIQRMKALGVVAAVQPFTICTPDKDVKLLGPARAKQAYPFHSLFKAGVPVAFGSDIPAEVDYQPLLAIYYAVTRKDKSGKQGPLNAGECFTPVEALYCYTMGSAYAEFMENEKGSITQGKLADMTLLSADLTTVPKETIKNIDVLMTIVGGEVVYDRNRLAH